MSTTLSGVCELIVDSEHKTAPKSESGFPLVRTSDIGRGRLKLSGIQRVDRETYAQWTQRAVPREGDLILAREAPVGNVAVVTKGLRPALGQRTVLLRPDRERADPHFLCYLLLGNEAQHWMSAVSNGATVPHLNMSDIRELPLGELPPLEVQQRVGRAIANFDDLIENNRRRIEILEEMARLLYREWFVHYRFPGHENVELVDSELGPIPEGWAPATFGDLVETVTESRSPDQIDPNLPLVGLEHLPRRSTTLREWDLAAGVGSRKTLFERGDVLFGKIRPYFHKVVSAPIHGACSTDAIVFRPRTPELGSHALAVASDDAFVAMTAATSNGTKMPRANVEVMLSYPIARPPTELETQFHNATGPMVELANTLSSANRVLRQARDLLLPRLVSGELDVSDLDLGLEAVS